MTITEFLLERIAEDEMRVSYYGDLAYGSARVLAECEAKRRIVERHSRCDDVSFGDASTCPDLRALASVYADHPNYDQAWRP